MPTKNLKANPKVKEGDQVCYMLAFGQFYLAEVTEVYADQVDDGGYPTVDLKYDNVIPAYHVSHDANAQQAHTYTVVDDSGWSPSVPKPDQASPSVPKPDQASPSVPRDAAAS